MLLRMPAHPLAEVREYADLMLVELRKVIPAFLKRVDVPDRGWRGPRYWRDTREAVAGGHGEGADRRGEPEPRPEVTLTDWDPDGEKKVVAAAMYAASRPPRRSAAGDRARRWRRSEREALLTRTSASAATAATSPAGRSSAPSTGSTCSATTARSATSSATARSRSSGSASRRSTAPRRPREIDEAGLRREWHRVMEASAALERELARRRAGRGVAQYAVSMAYRIRFVMQMNAREAMHLIELRPRRRATPRTGASPRRCTG